MSSARGPQGRVHLTSIKFPLTTPCLNAALHSGVHASMVLVWINIENGEQEKSLMNMPKWSYIFDPDCRLGKPKTEENDSYLIEEGYI